MATSKRVHSKGHLPGLLLLPVPWSMWQATANPHLHRGPSNTHWLSVLGYCFFPLGPGVNMVFFVLSKSEVSISPNSVEVPQSNPTNLQNKISWGFLNPLPIPRLRRLMWDSDFQNSVRTSLELLFSNLWVTQMAAMRFDFIMIVSLLSYSFSFSFVLEYRVSLFGGFHCPPVNGYSTAS